MTTIKTEFCFDDLENIKTEPLHQTLQQIQSECIDNGKPSLWDFIQKKMAENSVEFIWNHQP